MHLILISKAVCFIKWLESNLADIKCGVHQGSILWLVLFLIYINDLNVAIKYSEVHHFADDTNFLNINNCVNSICKQVSLDLKSKWNWLKTNKIYLYVGKTEFGLLISPKNQLDSDFKMKVRGKDSVTQIQSNI